MEEQNNEQQQNIEQEDYNKMLDSFFGDKFNQQRALGLMK